jgi:hypothetical protein
MRRDILQDLGDGLVLRRALPSDAAELMAFHSDVLRDPGVEEPDAWIAAWTQDLMSGEHPTFEPGDFTIVEDTHRAAIVSSVCLISQTWSYGGVQFGVGRPELVGTHPNYRRRGLVRAQFQVIHQWSANRGEMAQAITGIPWYYRQFGYEMGLSLGGSRAGFKSHVPKLQDSDDKEFHVRSATENDLTFIAETYEQGMQRYLVTSVRDEALWRYELHGKSDRNVNRRELRVIETAGGERVGFLAHPSRLWQNKVGATLYELSLGTSWLAITPAVVRYLWAVGEEWATRDPKQELDQFAFWLGAEHPAYQVFGDQLPETRQPYAWYLRVANLPRFLRHLAPVLERRLADSHLPGHTAQLHISFYRDGLRFKFENGHLIAVEPWQPTHDKQGDAAFPDLTFLQLLFGYRSLEELKHAFADCWTANSEGRALLEALFPKMPSGVWPVS